MKGNFKTNESYQNFLGERAVRLPGKWSNVTLIHLKRYNRKFLQMKSYNAYSINM